MNRARLHHGAAALVATLLVACPTPEPPDVPPDVVAERRHTAASADPEPARASDLIAPDIVPAPSPDADTSAAPDASAATTSEPPRPSHDVAPAMLPTSTEVALAKAGDGYLSLTGFPGVSADGMHLALVVGDRLSGPLRLRVTRLDGSVLVDKVLLEAGEAPAGEGHAMLRRRIEARAAGVQRVLAKAGMRALGPASLAADGGTALIETGDLLSVTLPGFAPATYPRTVLDRPCAAEVRVGALYTDLEHGLVVARLAHSPAPSCPASTARHTPFGPEDWQIFSLAPLP